jgi:hypothetical protein
LITTGAQTIAGAKTLTSETVISTSSSSDALRITQTGNGNALVVEDSTNPDATAFKITADGDVYSGGSINTIPNNAINGVGFSGFTSYNSLDTANSNYTSLVTNNIQSIIAAGTNGSPEGGFLPIAFYTGGSQRMQISTSGDLLVGRQSSVVSGPVSAGTTGGNSYIESTSDLLFNGNSAGFSARGYANNQPRDAFLGVFKHSGITNPCAYLKLQEEDSNNSFIWVSNAGNLMISTNFSNIGTATGTVVGTQTSDERVKNVKPEPFSYGLSDILALNPIEYELKDEVGTNKLGFTAQQTQSIIPEAVYNTGDVIPGEDPNLPKLGMDYSQIIPVLVKAIQELSQKVEELENRLNNTNQG